MKSSSASVDLIVDAGPLIALARLNLLQLPSRMFARALVTDVVAAECLADPAYPEFAPIQTALDQELLERLDCNGPQPAAMWNLDKGEASTIDLALRLGTAVLVDDLAARRVARELKIPILGTCGLLLLAKRRGHVNALRPLLEQLIESGYYLGDRLVKRVLQKAGEY